MYKNENVHLDILVFQNLCYLSVVVQSNPDVTKDDGKSNIGKGQSLEGEVTLGDVAQVRDKRFRH